MKARERDDRAELLLRILSDFSRESKLPTPEAGIDLGTRLETDLGLDSLARSELLARVERGMRATLPEEALLAATPGDLLALLRQQSPTPAPAATFADTDTGPALADTPGSARSLIEVLQWHVARHPDRVHILFDAGGAQPLSLTYADLYAGAGRVAGLVRRRGLRAGDRAAIMLPSGPEYFFSFFGVLLAGGIPVPIYPPARLEQIEDHLRRHAGILENAGTSLLITLPQGRNIARLLRALVRDLRDILALGDIEKEAAPAEPAQPDSGDIAFLQYTSGSTGDPKGVILTHADLLANIRAMGEAARVTSRDVFVSWLPLYHDMGLIGAWLGSLYFGVKLVSMSPLAFLARPQRWLQAIHKYRGTLSAAPNFAYELCLKRLSDADLAGMDLRSWRWAFNGAEPVSAHTLQRFGERFRQCGLRWQALAPVYGLAEAGVGLAFPPPERGPRIDCIDGTRFAKFRHALRLPCSDPGAMQIVACGRPLPGYLLRVVDEEGRALPERHEGLLQFQGPSATRGYYRNPEATKRLIRNGWHDTGDRAYLAAGEVYLTGRVKDLIIRGGRNIYPYELEQAVGEIAGIRKGCVAAFAAADPRSGSERLVVVAETRERGETARRRLETTIRDRALDIVGVAPDAVVLAPPRALPKTSSGKLRRSSARDLYLGGRLVSGPRNPLWQLVRVSGTGVATAFSLGLHRAPSYLYAGYAWVLCGLIAPWVWLGVVGAPRVAWRWALVRGGVRLLRRLAGVRLTVSGSENLPPPNQAFVLAANHQSYLDALAIIEAVPRPLAFVAKRELADNAILGRFLKRLGTLFVDRFDPQRGAAASEHIFAELGQGTALAFFPEGTFREAPGLLPYHTGAFVAAARQGLCLLPVALRGTRGIMAGDRFLPRPGRCSVFIGTPISPDGSDWASTVRLRDETRAFALRHCGEPDCSPI